MKKLLTLFVLWLTCASSLSAVEKPMSIIVIGGGPTGLAAAIEARMYGADVLVVEKRSSYVRENTLFLYSATLDLFEKWGVEVPSMQELFFKGEKRGYVLIKNLEESLAKRVDELGIKKIQGEFQEFVDGEKAVIIATTDGDVALAYDILVGADGPKSRVREKLGIPCTYLGEAIAGAAVLAAENQENTIGLEETVHKDVFIKKITIPSANILLVQSRPGSVVRALSQQELVEYARDVGWKTDAEQLAQGVKIKLENIHITVQRAHHFSNQHRGAIILGDAAGCGSFYRGMGANFALKTAELFGEFLGGLPGEGAYLGFEQELETAVDTLIQDSMRLFVQ